MMQNKIDVNLNELFEEIIDDVNSLKENPSNMEARKNFLLETTQKRIRLGQLQNFSQALVTK